jgi:hypothetical protein
LSAKRFVGKCDKVSDASAAGVALVFPTCSATGWKSDFTPVCMYGLILCSVECMEFVDFQYRSVLKAGASFNAVGVVLRS